MRFFKPEDFSSVDIAVNDRSRVSSIANAKLIEYGESVEDDGVEKIMVPLKLRCKHKNSEMKPAIKHGESWFTCMDCGINVKPGSFIKA